MTTSANNELTQRIIPPLESGDRLTRHEFERRYTAMPHVKKAAIAVGLLNATVLLELLDFEPIFWTFDSHSLWHLATAPIHFVWYQFVLDDCEFLYNQAKKDIGKMV